jgi:hypothetical protein
VRGSNQVNVRGVAGQKGVVWRRQRGRRCLCLKSSSSKWSDRAHCLNSAAPRVPTTRSWGTPCRGPAGPWRVTSTRLYSTPPSALQAHTPPQMPRPWPPRPSPPGVPPAASRSGRRPTVACRQNRWLASPPQRD